mgnify:CR=1 FL=1
MRRFDLLAMIRHRQAIYPAVLALLVAAFATTASAADPERQHESFVLYLNAGVVFPGGGVGTDYHTGGGAGGGIGLPVGDGKAVSLEVVGRFSAFQLPIDTNSYRVYSNIPRTTSASSVIISLEFKVRFDVAPWLRSYVSIGGGMIELDSSPLAAVGVDIAPGRRERRLFFIEARYYSPDTFPGLFCLNAGMRLG